MVIGMVKGIMFLFLIMTVLALFLAGGIQYFLIFMVVYLVITILFTTTVKGIKSRYTHHAIMKMEEEAYKARIRQEVYDLYGPFGTRRYIPPSR
jgi:cobalamin biosynthesis protein CobD/CbiB